MTEDRPEFGYVPRGESFEENIRAQWQATYNDCDPAVEGERKYSLIWFRAGYLAWLKDGQQISQQMQTEDEKSARDSMWNLGYAQGISYAAFQAAKVNLRLETDPIILRGANMMREIIVVMLEEAAACNRIRAEVKA